MKKPIKIILIILGSLAIILLAMFVFAKILGAELRLYTSKNSLKSVSESIPLENIDNINIYSKFADINIKSTEEENLKVVKYYTNNDNSYEKEVSDSTISISDFNNYKCIGICINMPHYDIFIPTSYKGNITIKTVSGDITSFKDLIAPELNIKTTNGNITLDNTINTNTISINSVSGDITINDITADHLNISTTNGNLNITSIDSPTNIITTASGNITLNNLVGGIDINSISGDVNINLQELTLNSEIKTISGNVDINTNGEMNLETDTITGSVKINGSLTSGKKLFIKTTSGDISVK